MRVKQFEDKMHEDPDFMWFTNSLFPKTLATEGKRVDASARLMRLVRKAYTLSAQLEPEPKPEPLEPEPQPVEATHGEGEDRAD